MITIVIKKNNSGFLVEGHANYAENGADIVCASVSAITQTALSGIIDYTQPSFAMKDGYLEVDLHETSIETTAILKAMEKGLREIRSLYSDYIQFKEEGYDEE